MHDPQATPGRPRTRRSLMVAVAAAVAIPASALAPAGAGAGTGDAATPAGTGTAPAWVIEDEQGIAPGVRHAELAWPGGERLVEGDLLTVDLRNPHVSLGLLYPGSVAAARPVSEMAQDAGAVAGVNADFFNIGETNAPVGPAVDGGEALKGAVPRGQRYGPGAPGLSTEDVFVVGTDRRGRLDRLTLEGAVLTPDGTVPLDGLNQYAVRVDGVGAFTPEWGEATRRRATCGTDTDRGAPCSDEVVEVVIEDGVVTAVRDEPGAGPIPEGTVVLVGREGGAATLRSHLSVGDAAAVSYELASSTGAAPVEVAAGGAPILRDGVPSAGLDDRALAPRTAAGVSADGRRLVLLTIDGRSAESLGVTVDELADLLVELGADDGMNLDGGGSSTLVARERRTGTVTVRNVPSDGSERRVPNGLGVFSAPGRPGHH